MSELSQAARGQNLPQQCSTAIDLILQARAMRYRWFAPALARLSAKLGRLGAKLVARPAPTRRPPLRARLPLSAG